MNIEEKTKLAHEYLLRFGGTITVADAWEYADAMEAEAEKRIKAKAEKDAEESKVFFEELNMADSPQLEFQVDWSVAPDEANYWVSDEQNFLWFGLKPTYDEKYGWQSARGNNCYEIAPSFNYQGDWKDSLRKRPK